MDSLKNHFDRLLKSAHNYPAIFEAEVTVMVSTHGGRDRTFMRSHTRWIDGELVTQGTKKRYRHPEGIISEVKGD